MQPFLLGNHTGILSTTGWQQLAQQREAGAFPADTVGTGSRNQQQGIAFRDTALSDSIE